MEMQDITIPPLPVVVMQVIRFDPAGETADTRTLENIIAPDKGVCADVLRVANSAFYGRSGRVKAMRDAIGLLGLKAVKNLVIFLSTKALTAPLRGDVFRKHLIEFPIVAALVAENLALQTKLANPEEAFL
ncbi:MAG: HDOD domain-containing protein, partial [Spirochaetia bacterium]|nr:HDOD domain-containing protein [Spirochaetia bacterium]